MFGRKKTKKPHGVLNTFIDDGTEIEGKYVCSGTVMIDAKLRGEITAKDTLVIGPQGVVHAAVQAATVIIRGEVVGNVTASERVELGSGARVTGDVEAPVVSMEEGAVLDGALRMTKARPVETTLALVASRDG
jgi:cytoskeletal protein CcmA (bactofilin family)